MEKKFVILIKYEKYDYSSEVAVMSDTPDLIPALEKASTILNLPYKDDKSGSSAHITGAKIIPLYDYQNKPVHKKGENK